MDTLEEYLRQSNPSDAFEPIPQYIPEGDCVVCYFKPESSYGEYLNEWLTVYRSEDTGEIVGCQIKGINRLSAEALRARALCTLDHQPQGPLPPDWSM